jgi:GH18 family chitinase
MQPEGIAAGALTHINIAFILFDETFKIVDTQGDIVARISRLKASNPGLRVLASVGGWSFNDPPTSSYFSNMVSNAANREIFITSLVLYYQKYGLDGVDIGKLRSHNVPILTKGLHCWTTDWEYPAALDRGGVTADTENFVQFLSELKGSIDLDWEISVTLPSSYWYLQGFDLPNMQKYVSWFNFLSYDLHGA